MSRNLFLAIGALAIAVVPLSAVAQPAPGVIAGVIRDGSGAPVPGAVVRVVNQRTGSVAVVVSDEHGAYHSGALTAGAYRLETELEGFDPAVRQVALEPGETSAIDVTLDVSRLAEALVVTARRVEEVAQEVPIPVSVVGAAIIEDTGAFNVNHLKDLVPTVQFYTTNPRNSAVNIRGIGAPFGLTNDGIEQGVGMYVDGVFYARPAAATLDFLDVERIEVLRGPQGTLFGKNTTAGAINVTTRRPSFTPAAEAEINYGSFAFVQARGSITGPLSRTIAARASFSSTQRSGTVGNTATGRPVNDLNNLGVRGQVLFTPRAGVALTLAVDHTRQRPEGFTQVVAGVAPTLRPANRQYPKIAADLGYTPPSFNAFDRLTDVDSPLRSHQDLGGAAITLDWKLGRGQADLDDGLAVLGLEPVKRSRLHRPASDDGVGGAVAAASMDAGGALRRRSGKEPEPGHRRLRVSAIARVRSVIQAGTRLGGGPVSSRPDARSRHTRACSTAMASISTSTSAMSVLRSSPS